MIVGIPTLHRYDLLALCLGALAESIVPLERVIVVDNGGSLPARHGERLPIEVIRPGRNLGVAVSWNLIHRRAGRETELVLINDDVVIAPETLARMSACDAPFVSVSATPGFERRKDDPQIVVSDWSCFLQRPIVWDSVGEYDETFWPAGHEDTDYWHRMRSAGFDVMRIPPEGMTHVVSASLQELEAKEAQLFASHFRRNQEYYLAKWGGPPGRERFRIPFDEGASHTNGVLHTA